jgi:PAS domain S-box-containing protein
MPDADREHIASLPEPGGDGTTISHTTDSGIYEPDEAGGSQSRTARDCEELEHDEKDVERLRLRAVVDASDDAILSKTMDGVITYWNPAACRLYGYTQDEMIGQSVTRLIPPDRVPEFGELMAEISANRRVDHHDTVRIRKDGARIDVSLTISPVKDDTGVIVGASTIARDIGSRKASEAALNQSEKQYRLFVETAEDAIWTVDSQGITTFVSPTTAELLGYTVHEMLGQPMSAFMDEQGLAIAARNTERERQGIREQLDSKFLRKDGTTVWALLSNRPQTDADGDYAGMAITLRDITEHRLVEERSRLNGHVVENMQVGLLVFRLERPDDALSLRLISVNHAASTFTGLSMDQLIGKFILDAFPALRGTGVPEIYLDGAQRQMPRELGDVSYQDENLDPGFYSNKVFPLPDSCVGVMFENITERKHAVDALAHAKERFARAFQSSPVALTIYRVSDACFLDVNDAYQRLLGYRREDLISGKDAALNIYVNLTEQAEIQHVLKTDGTVRNYETMVRAKSGEQRDVLCSLETIDLEGEACILASYVDITERQSMEREIRVLNSDLERRVAERTKQLDSANQRLSALNHELEAFAYSVSHDLRAPLRHIDGFSKALQTQHASNLDERGLHYLERIRNGTKRMGTLIDDLLGLSRFTRSDLRVTSVNLSELASRIASEIQSDEPERRVTWNIGEGLTVRGDEVLLSVALTNLLGNAWKFSQHNVDARIELGSETIDGETVYTVRDNGVGFDMEYVDKLFSPFKRLHSRDEFEGTGIGLATTQRIVHRHGGRIWAEASEGKGATFSFTLRLQS